MKQFETVAQLKLSKLTAGQTVTTKGYYSPGDIGRATYLIAAPQSVDGFGSHALANANVAIIQSGGEANIKQYGAKGDGVNDDLPALVSALASETTVYAPTGEYSLELAVGSNLTPLANTVIYGEGRDLSIFNLVSTDAASKVLFDHTNSGLTIKGLGFTFDGLVSDSIQFLKLQADDIIVDQCRINGGNTAINSNLYNFIFFTDTNIANLSITNNEISNVQRVQLRPNTTTGDIDNVLYENNYIHDLGQGCLQFNMPNPLGVGQNIRIISNHFEDFHAGTEQIFCGGASVKNLTIVGNTFSGAAKECVHIEEDAENIVISGNIFDIDGDGIFILDNNVGDGTYYNPKYITITGNTFFDAGLVRANIGIRIPDNAAGIIAAEGVVIADNTIKGFDQGLVLAANDYEVRGNVFVNCNTGILAYAAQPTINGNTFLNVDKGVLAQSQGGLLGKNAFKLANNLQLMAQSAGGERISMTGFILSIDSNVSLPASTITNVGLKASVGSEMFGSARVNVYVGSGLYQHRISEIDYDGATLTDTEKMRAGSGGVNFNGFINNAGELSIAFNNTTGSNLNVQRLALDFDGMWISVS